MSTIKPHITEKSYQGYAEANNGVSTYTFKTTPELDKYAIKKLVEKEYKVTVTDVRIINIPGKSRRFKGIAGRTNRIAKAVVSLKKGDRIAAFDVDTKKDNQKTEANQA